MQFESPNTRLELVQAAVWNRARSSMGGGVPWSALIVLLLTFEVASSTATAGWVGGIQVIVLVALLGALLLAVLAVSPIPWPAGLALGMVLGPVAALIAAGPALHAAYPTDPALVSGGGVSLRIVAIWWGRITDGSAANDPSFYLFLISWLMWVTGAWLSWCVLRWRKPLLGLIPGAAAFATNLLNIRPGETDQNTNMLFILGLTLALLLWTNYTGSIASATRAHIKLTGDARWDFWESGLVAMAALIVLAVFLPPVSTIDRTVDIESTFFSNWAQLQQRLNHPGAVGLGAGGSGTTGFSTDVPLGGSLTRTRDPVFTYTVIGDYAGPKYFRGVNETSTLAGEWHYPATPGLRAPIPKNQAPNYAENYQKLAGAVVAVHMIRPPIGNTDILFYPGQLERIDRPTVATQVVQPLSQIGTLNSIDRLSSASPSTSAGSYRATVDYSSATDAQLQAAGTNYPEWVQQFATLPASGYRTADVMSRIHDLAVTIVNAAGATNPYDEATAIQNFLRDPKSFSYTLTPPKAPVGTDRLYYFLFTSKQGYCEYFATSMGDMLRSLGIPTRLVNGFGPGTFDAPTNSFIVRGEDAHTWVESYFPSYGWITFEPTPDPSGAYQPIPRGSQGQTLCLRDENCDPGTTASTGGTAPSPSALPPGFREPNNAGSGPANFGFRAPDAGTLTTIVGVLLALILLLGAAVARYLRPRSVMGVWKRAIRLSELAGAKRRPGETPLELGRRLQRSFPEASEPVGALAGGFMVAAYAPEDIASSSRSSVMEAWSALRPLLVRRVLARLRPNRA
jgi:transglutaminase-like putative cysteine protease